MNTEESDTKLLRDVLDHDCEECQLSYLPDDTDEETEEYSLTAMPILDKFLNVNPKEENDEKVSLFWKLVWWWNDIQFKASEQANKLRQEKQAAKELEQIEKNRIRSVIQNYMITFNDERYNSYFEHNAWGSRIRNKNYIYSRRLNK